MPLWNIYHTPDTLTVAEKHEIGERVATVVYPHLPPFYVGVAFHELPADKLFIGGKPAQNFVRIAIDHIARTLPTPAHKADYLRRAREAVVPMFSKRGFRWEMHVDETPRDLWLIQGLVPPMPNTEHEKKWHADNLPSPYEDSAKTDA